MMLRKSASPGMQRLNGESIMSTSSSDTRKGILTTIPQGRGLGLQLGRDKNTTKTNKIEGRDYPSNKPFYSGSDLVGLIERARYGFLPLSCAARYGISRLVDSRNCYEIIQRGFVIPRSNNNHERIRYS